MPTHDYSLANQSGASFRTDLNNALAAIQSNNSNSSSPATTVAYQWWADTSASIFKIRNSSNNAWINLFTLAGGIDVDSASTFSADVSFQGSSNKDINFDASAGTLTFLDNAIARFGTGADLTISHDGSNSFITNATNDLTINSTGDDLILKAADDAVIQVQGSENAILCNGNGNTELYADGALAAQASTTGFSISGDKTLFIGSAGDFRIGHDGTDNFLNSDGSQSIRIQMGGNNIWEFGNPFFKGNDGKKIILGDSSDFQFFHSNPDNIIDIRNNMNFKVMNESGGANELMIEANPNSVVRLYADGVQKMLTNSFGIQIINDQKILFKKESSTSGSVTCIDFDKDNPTNNVGDISMTNSAVSYNTGSDYRLKENERPIDDAIEKVKLLKPYYFNFIETPEILSQGFYAHEVSDIVPTAVKGEKDQVALNGMPIYQKLDQSKIVPMLAAGLKALIEKVEKLETA